MNQLDRKESFSKCNMEKEPQPESITTVTIKPDYPPSEYSSEPPPAYHRGQSSAVQVAKIVAVTVVLVSVVLGSFILASAYVTANASCRQLELELLGEAAAADRFQQPLQPEALTQEESHHQKRLADSKSEDSDSSSSDNSVSSDESDDDDNKQIKFKLPLQLDFDDLAGQLFEKNQKSRMNCVVEKKRAEEIVDHKPKTLNLPFGLNLTTDPRLERISGERMAIFCESGNMMQRENPSQQEDSDESNSSSSSNDSDDDSDEATIMIQPVMVPIPQSPMATHMAHQMPMQPPMAHQSMHPMETMRPPMPPQASAPEFPPQQFIHHIVQQIIAQKIMDARRQAQEQNTIEQARPEEVVRMPQGLPIPEEILSQLNRLPHREQLIVTVADQDSGENQQQPQQQQPQEMSHMAEMHVIPQPINTQIRMVSPQEMQQPQIVQQQRSSAQEMNGRQTYARGLPVHIPIHMVQKDQQEPIAAATEEMRPHYVQPRSIRSVRSVDALLPKEQKRIKRCSCDCAC